MARRSSRRHNPGRTAVTLEGRMAEQQNFSNHAKFFPPFHFFAAPILLANLVWSFFRVRHDGFTAYSIFQVFVAAALVMTLTIARVMALKVQDRVIRDRKSTRLDSSHH